MRRVVLCCILLFGLCSSQCVFPALPRATWTNSSVSQALTCLKSVALNANYKRDSLVQLRKLVDLYSFTDMSTDSGAPHNIKVDLRAGLNQIETTNQASEWDFQYAVSRLLFSLGDAHTLYIPPTPFANMAVISPFFLQSSVEGGQQVVRVKDTILLTNGNYTYNLLKGIDVTVYVGKRILSINGVPVIDYLTNLGKTLGTTRDNGVALNEALIRYPIFLSYERDWNEVAIGDTFVFEGVAQPVLLSPIIYWFQRYTSQANFAAGIPFTGNKRFIDENSPSHIKLYLELDGHIHPNDIHKERKKIRDMIASPLNNKPEVLKRQVTYQVIKTSSDGAVQCIYFNQKQYDTLIISTFSPPSNLPDNQFGAWYADFVNTIESCVDHSQAMGVKNLLIDVRGNGGGVICAGVSSHLAIFEEWDPATNNHLFEPYDHRKSTTTDVFFRVGYDGADQNYNDPALVPTGNFTSDAWYTNTQQYTRGGLVGDYTPKWYFPMCADLFQFNRKQGYTYEKVLALTDGLCGSTCNLFLTKMRYHGKVATVSMGGIKDQPLDTASFAGGNVYDWQPYIASMGTGGIAGLKQFPTSAAARFNYREVYMGNEGTPREFQRYEADYRLESWNLKYATLNDRLVAIDQSSDYFTTGSWPVQPLGNYYGETSSTTVLTVSILWIVASLFFTTQ